MNESAAMPRTVQEISGSDVSIRPSACFSSTLDLLGSWPDNPWQAPTNSS